MREVRGEILSEKISIEEIERKIMNLLEVKACREPLPKDEENYLMRLQEKHRGEEETKKFWIGVGNL